MTSSGRPITEAIRIREALVASRAWLARIAATGAPEIRAIGRRLGELVTRWPALDDDLASELDALIEAC